ncbi:unnamed protein product [Prorocentrum cordatum]|uniref:Uncharacterized protein n=1 Tax=Prorocentrum cordatum TaxID=2364126 RepID=A0ABN9W6H1_9DINO|nr:unnamed protein product [Polarella glacialis]
MQSAVGVLVATLTFILRDAADRTWRGEPSAPLAPCDTKVEVSCPESAVAPGIVEDIVRRVKAQDCVCVVDCQSYERDLRLVGGTGLVLIVGQLFAFCVISRCPLRCLAIKYPGGDLCHERVAMGPGFRAADGLVGRWWVLTPDGDFYDEDITMEGEEGESLMVLDLMANCPASLRGKFYRFAADAYPSSDQIRREAKAAVARMRGAGQEPPPLTHFVSDQGQLAPLTGVGRRLRLGAAPAAGGGEPPAAAGGTDTPPIGAGAAEGEAGSVAPYLAALPERPALRDDWVWIIAENAEGADALGREVTLQAGDVAVTRTDALVRRRGGFLRARAVASSDSLEFVRGLRARYSGLDVGERFKAWKKAAQESREGPIKAIEVQGPPGALHLARHVERYGGDPRRWWQEFARSNNIGKIDGVFH